MQSFKKREIEWAADAIAGVAGQMENYAGLETTADINRGLSILRAEQLRSIAGRLAKAAADGDKRIAIR